jgi:uncharacterized protein (TIGR02284 family)
VQETTVKLDDRTLSRLEDLIQTHVDSQKLLMAAADRVNDKTIAHKMRDIAAQRVVMAEELRQHVVWNGRPVDLDESFGGGLHQALVSIRGLLNGGDPTVILIEIQREGETSRQAYRDAIAEIQPETIVELLRSHATRLDQDQQSIERLLKSKGPE